MKPMDYNQFRKWIVGSGYSIGTSTKHHVILDADDKVVAWFAVSHKQGGKKYIKGAYIANIKRKLGI